METFRTEGIVLQTVNFRDYDLIASVFTPSTGILKIIVPKGNNPKKGMKISPLCRIEIVYSVGRGELVKCQELTVVDFYPDLRDKLESLQAAAQILQSLLDSHFPDKPAPQLYLLLLTYLEKIPHAKDPFTFAASFRLKILRHEGIFGWSSGCSVCGELLTDRLVHRGESFCKQHGPLGVMALNAKESSQVERLAFSRDVRELGEILMDPILLEKVQRLFFESFE